MIKRTYTFSGDGEKINIKVTPIKVRAFKINNNYLEEIKRFRVLDRQEKTNLKIKDITPRLTHKIQILGPKQRNINVELERIA
ncbi:MAG TPA: hypothetical protein VJH20_03900 [Candidatus Nanoarchaeia archaeon]|nr:hypothetical protein [Candidatus Nanoarchaeia archaeon]